MATNELKRIEQRFLRAQKLVEPFHHNIERWRRWYDFEHYRGRPKPNEPQYADPTPTNTVDLAVGILLANKLDFRANAWMSDRQEEEETSKVEKYCAGTIEVNSQREGYHIEYETTLNFARDGVGILYSVWDNALAREYLTTIETEQGQLQVYRETPIRTQVIDPLKMFMVPGGSKGRWLYVCRVEEMSVFDVEMEYNVQLARFDHMSDEQKMEHLGRLIDYWEYAKNDKEVVLEDGSVSRYEDGTAVTETRTVVKNAIIFDNDTYVRPLRVMEGYDEIPYTIQFFKPVKRDDPKQWSHNIIRPLENTVQYLEKAINRRSRQIDVFSSLPLVTKTMPGRQVQVDPGMGNIVNMRANEDVGFPRWPGNAPDVEQQISFFRGRLQQSGFSDVVFGAGASQVSGYALSQLGDQNRIRLEQPVIHLQMLYNSWAKKILSLTKNFAGPRHVRVYGRTRGKDFVEQLQGSFADQYLVRSQIKPEFPNEKVRKHAMATQARGVLSERTLMENYYDIEQPDDERDRRLQEMAENHPAMIQYAVILQLRKWAQEGDEAAGMALQALMAGNVQQGGQPPSRNPEQLLGTQSPNGSPTRQAQGGEPPGQSPGDEAAFMQNTAPQLLTGQV